MVIYLDCQGICIPMQGLQFIVGKSGREEQDILTAGGSHYVIYIGCYPGGLG